MPSYFSAKDERMFQHVLANTGSKAIAGATVNKYRAKHGKTKRRRNRSKPKR